ncbi:MAG: hypothetical protein Q7S84_02405 [bacterium]|nr:hypothetical protein [bacterium]
MLNYLLELLVMVSLGLILYLLARVLPRVSDLDTKPSRHIPVPHWATAYFERFDERALAILEKMIRRVRLWVLKIDNALLGRLERFRRPVAGKTPFSSNNEGSPTDERAEDQKGDSSA